MKIIQDWRRNSAKGVRDIKAGQANKNNRGQTTFIRSATAMRIIGDRPRFFGIRIVALIVRRDLLCLAARA